MASGLCSNGPHLATAPIARVARSPSRLSRRVLRLPGRPPREVTRCHICARTGLAAAASAPGMGSPLSHLRQDRAAVLIRSLASTLCSAPPDSYRKALMRCRVPLVDVPARPFPSVPAREMAVSLSRLCAHVRLHLARSVPLGVARESEFKWPSSVRQHHDDLSSDVCGRDGLHHAQ